jgi:hypothetical protein
VLVSGGAMNVILVSLGSRLVPVLVDTARFKEGREMNLHLYWLKRWGFIWNKVERIPMTNFAREIDKIAEQVLEVEDGV